MYINENQKEDQKDKLVDHDPVYPVEQVPDTGEPSKKEVKAAVKELNPDVNSLESR